MEITSRWLDKYRFEASNGRNHTIIADVPPNYGGENSGPTALELAIMGLTSCLGTTFKMISDKMHLNIAALEVKAIANKTMEDKTVTDIHLFVKVKSNESKEKLEKCLIMTEENCAVDLIFAQTRIPMDVKLVLLG
ncbi:MAG: OsmC family protein [Candidatus Thorarchaeota archaeon]